MLAYYSGSAFGIHEYAGYYPLEFVIGVINRLISRNLADYRMDIVPEGIYLYILESYRCPSRGFELRRNRFFKRVDTDNRSRGRGIDEDDIRMIVFHDPLDILGVERFLKFVRNGYEIIGVHMRASCHYGEFTDGELLDQ